MELFDSKLFFKQLREKELGKSDLYRALESLLDNQGDLYPVYLLEYLSKEKELMANSYSFKQISKGLKECGEQTYT
jgi:hypothetical protein